MRCARSITIPPTGLCLPFASPAGATLVDADGHVTETWEQIARHLDEPYRKRPLLTPLFPQDGWDRRLIGTKGNWAGDGKSWLEALDAGGMAMAVLYPTLGLFMPFLRDPEWAVALSRAYNTMLYKELTSQSARLKGVALLPLTMNRDSRGSFTELFRDERDSGLSPVQWNAVSSEPGTLRGVHLHIRHDDYLATLKGRACVGLRDLRRGSPTEGMSVLVELTGGVDRRCRCGRSRSRGRRRT